MKIIPVILASGEGTRLGPLSRKNSAKQFLELGQGINLFQKTIMDVADSSIFLPPVIICGQNHRLEIEDSLRKINITEYEIIIEPHPKNTGPAIADATLLLQNRNAPILYTHTDHVIQNDGQDVLNGNVEYRPWGYYENLTEGVGYKIKKIVVNPKSKLSLQSHEHRAEQWTVLKGIARVTIDDQVFELAEGQSTYIPIHAKHRLENLQNEHLEIIEIQLGTYLEEDDIKRFEDIYGRS